METQNPEMPAWYFIYLDMKLNYLLKSKYNAKLINILFFLEFFLSFVKSTSTYYND